MKIKLIFKHYWPFIKKRLFSQIMILVLYGFAIIATNVVIPLIYKGITNVITEGNIDAYNKLMTLVLFLALTILAQNVLFRLGDYIYIKLQSGIMKELSDYVLEKIQKHSYSFFANASMGGMVAKAKRFILSFETLQDAVLFQIWMNGIALFSFLFVLWREAPILGISFLIWVLFYCILVKILLKWQIPKSLENASADTKSTSKFADILTNILTVKMFANEEEEIKEFKKITEFQERKRTATWMQQGFWNNSYQGFVIGVFNIAMIWIAVSLWSKGIITAGSIILVQLYVLSSFNIVWNISKNIIRISTALTDANEMVTVFEEEVEVKDPKDPEEVKITEGKIEFKDVTFSYRNSETKTKNVFHNLNLDIEAGEKVALVGYSGAGKTTIVNLLLRFIDIQKGTIKIDEQDITKILQKDLRNKIAYVPQETALFHRTIRENISYGKLSASLEEITEASKKACADEFIKNLPNGYDSLVGERGIKLSGGERQRVAIARAMLKKASIVILDEATSSLDSLAEEKIQEALEKLTKGKTTIIIAHRLSTIKKMDRIIVFDDGKIVETGTHKNLLQKKGIYEKLWHSQVGGFIST
jgi:ATP-binding cassette subfamily B protein